MYSFSFPAIGTNWQIDIYSQLSSKKSKEVKGKILEVTERFDKTFSRFRKDSWVTQLKDKCGSFPLPQDAYPMLELYANLYNATDGLFTPLIGKALEQAGYDSDYSLIPKKLESPPDFRKTVSFDKRQITLSKPALLDFGAAGKGYLVDLVSEIIKDEGFKSFCVDGSGDLYYSGENEIRVGLEDPNDSTLAIGVCNIKNESICASSASRRKWGKFHHTINPVTLTSPDDIQAVWVIAKTAFLADALTTCLYLDPHPEHYKEFKFEYVLLYKGNKAIKSPGFDGELFSE